MTKNTNLTNAKAGKADPKEVDRIIRIVRSWEPGTVNLRSLPMKGIVSSKTSYSRAWQIAAYEAVSHFYPEMFVPAEVLASKDQTGQTIVAMRDRQRYSWGLIGVLCGKPESECRSEYRKNALKLDRGQRIGHGGRFLADDASIYDAAERHTNGAVLKAEGFVLGKLRDAAHAKDAETLKALMLNCTLEPEVKKAPARKRAAKKVAA